MSDWQRTLPIQDNTTYKHKKPEKNVAKFFALYRAATGIGENYILLAEIPGVARDSR
jgi:hypothetical protein